MFEFSTQYIDDIVDSLFLQICLLNQQVAWSIEYLLSCIETNALDGINHPLVNLIREFIQVDILVSFIIIHFAEYIDSILCQHGSQLDVHTATTDSLAHLIRLQEHFSLLVLIIDVYRSNGCRSQSTLNEQFGIVCIIDNIQILIVQFTYDTVNTATLHANTSSNWVDTLIKAFNSNLCAFSRKASNTTDSDQALCNLRNFSLQQTLQESRSCTAQDNLRIIVIIINAVDDCTNGLALTIHIARNLLCLRQDKFIVLIVYDKYLTLPNLVNFTRNDLSYTILVLIEKRIVFQLKNLRSQSLAKSQDSTATKLIEINLLTYILTYLVVRLNLARLSKCYFLIFVLYFAVSNNNTIAIDLEIALVRVNDNIEILITTENLSKNVAETFLQHTYQCSTVDILGFFKLAECINHTRCNFLIFFSHSLFKTD